MPRRFKIVVLLVLTVGGALGALAMAGPATPPCIRSWPEVREVRGGYDHVVHVGNDCRIQAHCVVSSDVSSEAIHVVVPAGEETEVITSHGSPAREFTPRVECHFVT